MLFFELSINCWILKKHLGFHQNIKQNSCFFILISNVSWVANQHIRMLSEDWHWRLEKWLILSFFIWFYQTVWFHWNCIINATVFYLSIWLLSITQCMHFLVMPFGVNVCMDINRACTFIFKRSQLSTVRAWQFIDSTVNALKCTATLGV